MKKIKHFNKCIAFLLSMVMFFSLTTPAFAANIGNNTNITSISPSAAAKQAFEYLSPEQRENFIAQIERIAWSGDISLVEFHHDYVDPSYNYNPNTVSPPIQTRAADVAGQLQALNLPTAVYYALMAFSAALGVPVGNVVDLVIGLGLGVIIIAYWDEIQDVWSDIIDIFVNAFGSVVNDAFEYIEGLVSGSNKYDTSKIDWDSGDKNHIMRGSNDGHVDGFRKLGFDPKDPNNWSKLLPFLKQTVEEADRTEGPTAVNGGSIIKYFKNFADKGVEICVKIFFSKDGGSPQLSDAWPVK